MADEDELVALPAPTLEDGQWDGSTTHAVATKKADYFDQISLFLKDAGESYSLLEAFAVLDVCPRGFADEFSVWVVGLESDVSVYHVMPCGGGILDEPEWLLEAFRSVRKATGDYYLWREKKAPRRSDI
jgi:hypothetical protein